MVTWDHEELSVRAQCRLLGLHRAGLYYEPVATSDEDLTLMRLIDALYLKRPYYGSRRMTVALQGQGHAINRKHVQRLMRLMDLEGLAPGPNTSRKAPQHAIYPYLLRGLAIERANQVWASDITYIPVSHGFFYLVAIIDWYSRRVLAWRLSNTLETAFCIEALNEALRRWGPPDIFNTDQGAQYTSEAWTGVLKAHGIRISMDGKGRCIDNIFVERLWRSLKYEEVFLKAYSGGTDARDGIGKYMRFFNAERPHQALGYRTPADVYNESRATDRKAA
jgi:putative transposase